jgi:MSHA biogenesis protein MshE
VPTSGPSKRVEDGSKAADRNPDSLAAAIDHHLVRMTADPATVRWLSLGSILTVAGLINEAELETALEAQKHRGVRLGAVLVELGLLTTRQIAGAIAEQCHVEFVDLDTASIQPDAVKLLSELHARRFEALPLEILPDGVLLLAMADPTNLRAHDDLRLALGAQPFRVAVADEAQLVKALGRAYRSRIELSVVAPDAADQLRRAEDIRDMASSTPTIQL